MGRAYRIVGKYLGWMQIFSFCVGLTLPAFASAPPPPTPLQLIEMKMALKANRTNLDRYYQYANAAAAADNLDEAAWALEQMLRANPALPRVRLELATLYQRMGRHASSKALFDRVAASNPPAEVQKNIARMSEQNDQATQTHTLTGGIQLGINRDSNANSASNSGQVTFADISIPLEDRSLKTKDTQLFASASVTHLYRFEEGRDAVAGLTWQSNLMVFGTEQRKIDSLNLGLLSLRTGPVVAIKDTGVSVGIAGIYNHVRLGSDAYLRSRGVEGITGYQFNKQLGFNMGLGYEDRGFINAPDVTTYTDRSGNMRYLRFSSSYALTPDDIFSLGSAWREENTRRDYLDNDQREVTASYTRALPWKSFATLSGLYRISEYRLPDPIISPGMKREDKERGYGLTLGTSFDYNLSWTIGYQYRHIDSTIQNYEYTNHRTSTAVGWHF